MQEGRKKEEIPTIEYFVSLDYFPPDGAAAAGAAPAGSGLFLLVSRKAKRSATRSSESGVSTRR